MRLRLLLTLSAVLENLSVRFKGLSSGLGELSDGLLRAADNGLQLLAIGPDDGNYLFLCCHFSISPACRSTARLLR